jgi:hypothetical protein
MKITLDILAQPLYFCVLLWHKLLTTSSIVHKSFLGEQAIEFAKVGELVAWLFLALIVAAIVIAALKFVTGNGFFGLGSAGNMLTRLIILLIIYALLCALLYVFMGYSHMVLNEM